MEKINAKVFMKVAEVENFKKAADELNYTQAGISYIISAMEDELQIKLFKREYGGVKLTSEGEAVLPIIKQIYSNERMLFDKVNKIKGISTGSVSIASHTCCAIGLLPSIVKDFKKEYPGIEIEILIHDDHNKADELLKEGKADFAIINNGLTGNYNSIDIYKGKMLAVSSKDVFSESGVFKAKDLEDIPYIGSDSDADWGVNRWFQKSGIKKNVFLNTDSDMAIFRMVEMGLGFSLEPDLILRNCPYNVNITAVEPAIPYKLCMTIPLKEQCTSSSLAFMEFMLKWIGEHRI